MSFRPNVNDVTINGATYRIAEHPAAPGIPYGQEGRAGIVYCLDLTPSPRRPSPLLRGEGKGGPYPERAYGLSVERGLLAGSLISLRPSSGRSPHQPSAGR
jgi:hypothetical protein